MEYLDGETLSHRLQKGSLRMEQALKIGTEIADALQKAHDSGIIHRDLKPGNIMLTKTGAKLMDFGLAKPSQVVTEVACSATIATVSKALTTEGTIVGTLQYMSPEQLEGKEADARSDVFALGAVLYEMFTGRQAFTGKSRASVIAAILTSEPANFTTAASQPDGTRPCDQTRAGKGSRRALADSSRFSKRVALDSRVRLPTRKCRGFCAAATVARISSVGHSGTRARGGDTDVAADAVYPP